MGKRGSIFALFTLLTGVPFQQFVIAVQGQVENPQTPKNRTDGIEVSTVEGVGRPLDRELVAQENAPENKNHEDGVWGGQKPSLRNIQQGVHRFHKDRELVSFIPTKSKEFASNRGSFMRSRRSYHTPGTLDLSRFYGENAVEDEDYRSEKERAAERERFMRFMSLLAMKEGGSGVTGNGNSNGLTNYLDNDFDEADEDDEPIELGVHYNPYSSSSGRVRQRQRNRNGNDRDRMFSNNLDNGDSNSGNDFLSPGEAISLESSHPKSIHPTNKQNLLQQKQHQRSPASGSQFPRRLTMAAASLKNGEDNEGYWSEDAIPLQAHSLTRRSGGNPSVMLPHSEGLHSVRPGFRRDPFENSVQKNDAANNFFNEFYQLQNPFMRNSDLAMNSRPSKSGDDGLYSLNQLLSGAQEIDPRIPIFQRNVL